MKYLALLDRFSNTRPVLYRGQPKSLCSSLRFATLKPFMAKKKEKNPHAVALGRLGGLKGGKARTSKLTPEQRRELARKAVQARWARKKKKSESPS